MRKWIAGMAILAMLVCIMIPEVCFTEDRDTVLLARAIYALGKDEAYDTKLALGTLVMNRVENGWFSGTLGGVLRDPQQFPAGNRYDDASLRAAHDVLSGKRTLSAAALYYRADDAAEPLSSEYCVAQVGGYLFYSRET